MAFSDDLRALRARLKLTQAELAERLGVSQATASRLLSGANRPSYDVLQAYHALAGEPPRAPAPTDAVQGEEDGANAGPATPASLPRRRLPVYGLAAGGDDGRFILNGQRIADVLCPPALDAVPNAYAVYIHGTSMEPRYYAGETAWVHPHLPVRSGDFVIVQIAGGEDEPPVGFVKRFVSMNAREIVLEQFNPPEGHDRLMRFPADRVQSVHKILFAGQS